MTANDVEVRLELANRLKVPNAVRNLKHWPLPPAPAAARPAASSGDAVPRWSGRGDRDTECDQVQSKVLTAPGVVAVDFYQASCPPCHALEPHLEGVATACKGQLPVYRVDIDRDLPLAERFQVRSIPTILLVRGGKETTRLDGYITELDLRI